MASLTVIVLTALLAPTSGARVGAKVKSFGHSVKNGQLPAGQELTTFEHTCGAPPCVVTQINIPSIYPPRGEAWNWTHGVISFYIDGEATPSLSMTLLELAGEAHFNKAGDNAQGGDTMPDGSPWGIALMGRTAKSGAVYSTVRIPFGKSFRSTIRAPESAQGTSTYWFVIRGLENHPVILGDLELPAEARLRLYRTAPTPVADKQLVTIANVSSGTAGALLRVHLDARALDSGFGYLEACLRFFADGAEQPMFLSSGTEDYFMSASYFDEGLFKTPGAGLTWFNRTDSSVGAYKTHTADPLVWSNGMSLVHRCGETTQGCGDINHCPNQFCNATQRAAEQGSAPTAPATKSNGGGAEYATLVWTYEWPTEVSDADDTAELRSKLDSLQRAYDVLEARLAKLETARH